jgi:flagellar motor switch protein FliM
MAARAMPMKRPPKIDPAEEALRKKAAPYEWGKTERFSQDQKKFLDRLFKQFAENVTQRMAPLLQTRVSMEYQNARLRPYSVFIQSLYEPITLITIRMDPETRGLLVLDFPLSFALIDRCLGGAGMPLEEIRYFTEIEIAVLERVVSRLMDGYQEAWGEIRECKPQYQQMEFNPQTVHVAKPSDTMVCVSFDIHMGQTSGPVYVVIPFEYLKAVIPRGSFEEFMLTRTNPPQSGPSIAPLFAKNLDAATVPLAVELGSTELSFGDLLVLEEGDFIKLDQAITEPLRIKVNDRTKFLGRPGLRERKVSVQITKVLQEGDENFDE